ncbi:hypothetical protein ABZW18_00455 [Streptomyces sp. NPDC004647]|uniref:hypothetical protein n=1 Tax=Streptomyces sp. NPDC004647 TaxID=3154671 RepID=UPI0033AC42D6
MSIPSGPPHERNVISGLLRNEFLAHEQLTTDRHALTPQPWLKSKHFQTGWLGEIYDVLVHGGLVDIYQHLTAHPGTDRTTAVVQIVTQHMWRRYEEKALAGLPGEALEDPQFWQSLQGQLRDMADPDRPTDLRHVRHDAYAILQQAPGPPSQASGQPSRPRQRDEWGLWGELAVIDAVIDNPAWGRPGHDAKFCYTPSDPEASPYWLQPQDFSDHTFAEVWDALVTGPDPAVALPEASDPTLRPEQRRQAIAEHIWQRLWHNDRARAADDPMAAARLKDDTYPALWTFLNGGSPNLHSNPELATHYAVEHVLEPSIPSAIHALAGQVASDGQMDASLPDVAAKLSETLAALDALKERINQGPRTSTTYSPADQGPGAVPQTNNGFADLDKERRVVLSLISDPTQFAADWRVQRLHRHDFTKPEHRYLFQASKNSLNQQGLPHDPALLAQEAARLAHHDRAAPLNTIELLQLQQAAASQQAPAAAGQAAGHLIFLTVRRATQRASTVMSTAANRRGAHPGHLIDQSRDQIVQATNEALRYDYAPAPDRPNTAAPAG